MAVLPELKYPDNWQEIRANILKRAAGRCERCGKERDNRQLQVAHLNHITADNEPDNLCAMCVSCHSRWDAPTRQMKKEVKHQVWTAMHLACHWKVGDGCKLRGKQKQKAAGNYYQPRPKQETCCFTKCPLVKAYRRDYRKEKP